LLEAVAVAVRPQKVGMLGESIEQDAGQPVRAHLARRKGQFEHPHGRKEKDQLTNGLSKKWANLEAAYALWFAYYNFRRVHQAMKVTAAMEGGLATRVFELKDLIAS